MVILWIYTIGAVIAALLLLLLAYYYKSIEHTDIEQLPMSFIVCIFSWIIVIMICVNYKDKIEKAIKTLFNRHDDTKV
jgi:Mn2+/Fe2+ NRAMP family transporter